MGFWKAFHTPGTCSIAIPASIIAAERWQFSRGPLQWTPWVRRIAPEALCQEFQCGPVGISPFSKDQTPTSVVECGKNPLKRDLYCQDCPVWQHVGGKWEKELRLGWVIYGVETGRSPKNVSFTPWFFYVEPKDGYLQWMITRIWSVQLIAALIVGVFACSCLSVSIPQAISMHGSLLSALIAAWYHSASVCLGWFADIQLQSFWRLLLRLLLDVPWDFVKDEWVFTHDPVILGHFPAIASALFLSIS